MSNIYVVLEWDENDFSAKGDSRGLVQRTKFRLEQATIARLVQRVTESVISHHSYVSSSKRDVCRRHLQHLLVEVYDKQLSAYVSSSKHTHCSAQVLTKLWGKVWRVRVSPVQDSATSTGAMAGSNSPATTTSTNTSTTRLALPGRIFRFNASHDTENHVHDAGEGTVVTSNLLVKIKEQHNQQDTTAYTVWDGAVLLATYLQARPHLVRGKYVLELGAGCGLVGLTAASLGAKHVLLTDLPTVLPWLQENTIANQSQWSEAGCTGVECMCLDWCDALPTQIVERNYRYVDVILLADCVWTVDLVPPLLATLKALVRARKCCHGLELWISYQRRGQPTHQAFWSGLVDLFEVEHVDLVEVGITIPHVTLTVSRCVPRVNQQR